MKPHSRLVPLIEDGLIDSVELQLMSGKEAMIFVVWSGSSRLCAKVYKEAQSRSFRQAASYTEGRKSKSSREARAMAKGSKYGRQAQEDSWQRSEVDTLYRLSFAGVRVPSPRNFLDGVLLMDLITDADGDPAPRLGDVSFSPEEARRTHSALLAEVVRMLCAGVVHGDLSEYNILISPSGPVIIDLPQAVNAAGNNSARSMLERDVNNLRAYFGKFAPELLKTQYAKEIWSLYEQGKLTPEAPLSGRFRDDRKPVDLHGVLREIDDAKAAEAARQARLRDAGLK